MFIWYSCINITKSSLQTNSISSHDLAESIRNVVTDANFVLNFNSRNSYTDEISPSRGELNEAKKTTLAST